MLGGEQHGEPGEVEQRQDAEVDVAGRQGPIVHELHAAGEQSGSREQRTAWPAAHGGRVEHHEARVGVAVRIGKRRTTGGISRHQIGEGRERRAAADPVPALHGGESRLPAVQHRLQIRVGDDDARCGIPHDIGDFLRAQSPVDGHQDGAAASGCAVEIDECEVVVRQHGDAVARADAGACETGRQTLDAGKMGGMGNALGSADERDTVGMETRVAQRNVEQREITHPHGGPP